MDKTIKAVDITNVSFKENTTFLINKRAVIYYKNLNVKRKDNLLKAISSCCKILDIYLYEDAVIIKSPGETYIRFTYDKRRGEFHFTTEGDWSSLEILCGSGIITIGYKNL